MKKSDLCAERQARLQPVEGHSGVFALDPPPIGSLDQQRFGSAPITHAAEALVRLQVEIEQLPNPDLVTRTLSRREAVLSSQIEGTQASLPALLEYECTHDGANMPQDVESTLSYVKALEYGLDEVRRQGTRAFTVPFIQALHRALMVDDSHYRDEPGSLRTLQNWIGGLKIQDARFVPPPPECVPASLDNLLDTVLHYEPEGVMHMHVLRRAAIAHAQFETIHPFRDGNGRTGRLLIPLQLAAEGYPPLYLAGPLYRNRAEYFDLLLGVQLRSDWNDWIAFFADAVAIACEEALDTTRALLSLRNDWRAMMIDRRVDAASRRLVEFVLGTPVMTANQAKDRLGISFPAASNALRELAEKGILDRPPTSRNRVFVARQVIEILQRPSASQKSPSVKRR
jgi:Fic family protein